MASTGARQDYNYIYATLTEALAGPHRDEFVKAMRTEIQELEEYGTWDAMRTWALRIKRYPDRRLKKFKGRFCAGGHKQVEGVDYCIFARAKPS
jgi:hypothetical protein